MNTINANKNPQYKQSADMTNSPKNLQIMQQMLPPPPPPPAPQTSIPTRNHPHSHNDHSAQQYFSSLQKQDQPPIQLPPQYALQYPLNPYQIPNLLTYPDLAQQIRYPNSDGKQQMQPNYIPPVSRFTNGITDISSTDSNSPPTSQSPALPQQPNNTTYNTNSKSKMNLAQSDEDRGSWRKFIF
jgi:hypothetical protein